MTAIILTEPTLIHEVQQIAAQEQIDAVTFITQAIRHQIAHYRQKRLTTETEAWYRLPPETRQQYIGQFVAVYQGQIVDNDSDRAILYQRLRQRYGRQTILITEGGDTPMPVYRVKSAIDVSSPIMTR
jgi:hypothetical protein